MINVRVNARAAIKAFGNLATNQLPFATARALTWTAQDAQDSVKRQLPHQFIIRNRYVQGGIRITPASKSNLEAEVGSITDFMGLHDEGGIKRPRGRNLAIPVNAKRNKRNIVTRSARPRVVLSRKDHFVGRTKHGNLAIFQRMDGHRLSMLYVLKPSAKIDPRLDLERTVNKVVARRFHGYFNLSLDEALR